MVPTRSGIIKHTERMKLGHHSAKSHKDNNEEQLGAQPEAQLEAESEVQPEVELDDDDEKGFSKCECDDEVEDAMEHPKTGEILVTLLTPTGAKRVAINPIPGLVRHI
ncbi:hypothetical protein BGZ76_007686 [Entomortierella beljakovae]|nr:hypothetical protein BGZ76_007686 [Entomortierella beljakovae]